MRTLRLSNGRRLKLGARLGAGGEGSVYAAANRRNCAVKLYKTPDRPQLADKVAAMVTAGLARQSPFATFPTDVVRTEDGHFAGFIMKAIRGRRPLHDLYGPGSRKQHFSDIDYRFLARTATNIARAIASIHRTGCVIGDINPPGILVAKDATVALVDADSFQFSHGSQQFLCAVGVPDYTPPELQETSFHGVVRSQQHDAFGLAVILFQTLMMGRHPFSGIPVSGDTPPIATCIQQYQYPYIPGLATRIRPPPGLPALPEFSAELSTLFAHAFIAKDKAERPDATKWVAALERFEKRLRRCRDNRRHHYPRDAVACPWCQMERQLGTLLFPRPGETGHPPAPHQGNTAPTHVAPTDLTQRRFRDNRLACILLMPFRALGFILAQPLLLLQTLTDIFLPSYLRRTPGYNQKRGFLSRWFARLLHITILASILLGIYHLIASRTPSLPSVQQLAIQARHHAQPWMDSARKELPNLGKLTSWMPWTAAPDDETKMPARNRRSQQRRTTSPIGQDGTASNSAHRGTPKHGTAPQANPTGDRGVRGSAALTITDKVLEMQRILQQHGYPAPLSGSFDRTTRRYAADYLASVNGEPVRENMTVREFHQAFQEIAANEGHVPH